MLRRELLARLREELSASIGPEDLAARLAEADAHLRDGIESRVELGMHPLEAEKEAVVAFGDPRRTARAMGRALCARTIAVRLRWLGTAYGALIAFYATLDLLRERTPYASEMILVGLVACLVGFVGTSFRARRAAPVPILATGLAASTLLWVFFGFFWLNLWNYGGMGFQARLRVARSTRIMRAELERPTHRGVDVRELDRNNLRAIPKAVADPVGNWASQCGPAFGLGTTVLGLFLLADFAGAGLGTASATRRRRRTGVA